MNCIRTASSALVLTLAACSGPSINRGVAGAQHNTTSFAILDIKSPIPWVIKNAPDNKISFAALSPEQFIERTAIQDLQLKSFMPGHVTGFEIVGAASRPDTSTLVCVNLQLNFLEAGKPSLWAIQFSPQGRFISMSNLAKDDLIPLFLKNND